MSLSSQFIYLYIGGLVFRKPPTSREMRAYSSICQLICACLIWPP